MNGMNKIMIMSLTAAVLSMASSCKDDDMFTRDGKNAFIQWVDEKIGFKVTGNSGEQYTSVKEGNNIYILVDPMYDVTEELHDIVPEFYLSKGATTQPPAYEPQDFSKEGGIKYDVKAEFGDKVETYIVSYRYKETLPHGEGFNSGVLYPMKDFAELGWPGTYQGKNQRTDRLVGDINGYVAFCGFKNVVVFARDYVHPLSGDKDLSLAFKVFSYPHLENAGSLNTSSIDVNEVQVISSDSYGHMIAVVSADNSEMSSIYYWTSPELSPIKAFDVNANISKAANPTHYLQVMGDITGTANVATSAGPSADGSHYLLHVENGKLSTIDVINTGLSSEDTNKFQMISPINNGLDPDYIVGDVKGKVGSSSGVQVFMKNINGETLFTMPPHLDYKNVWYWVAGTGQPLSLTGGKRPFVSAMNINGKDYSLLELGIAFNWGASIFSADMKDMILPSLQFTGVSSSSQTNITLSFSHGGTSDWCWDEKGKVGRCVYWHDRYGLVCGLMKCLI